MGDKAPEPAQFFRPPTPPRRTPQPVPVPSPHPPTRPRPKGSGAQQAAWIAVVGLGVIGAICLVGLFGAGGAASGALYVGLLLGGLALYFAPFLVARKRKHPRLESIAVVNFFLGWTLVGWVVALAWACAEPAKKATVQNADAPASGATNPAP